ARKNAGRPPGPRTGYDKVIGLLHPIASRLERVQPLLRFRPERPGAARLLERLAPGRGRRRLVPPSLAGDPEVVKRGRVIAVETERDVDLPDRLLPTPQLDRRHSASQREDVVRSRDV